MLAIVKKELRTYFNSMSGYIFLGFLVFLTGLFFVLINVMGLNPSYAATLGSSAIIFLILIPILTMRLFAEEARQKTDQLLYTSPITINQIVVGKFLAALLLFLIGMAITAIFPIILSRFGTVSFSETFGAFIGYILLGTCFIAVGLFISSLTESQIVAAVASFSIIFLMFVLDGLIQSLPSDRRASAIFLGIIALVIAYFIYDSTKNLYASTIFILACIIAGIILYFVNVMIYDGVIAKGLGWFSLFNRFSNFNQGILNIADIIYYITFSIAFIYLTISTIEKRRWK